MNAMQRFLSVLLLLVSTDAFATTVRQPSPLPVWREPVVDRRYYVDDNTIVTLDGRPCPWPPPANVVISRIVLDGRRIVRLELETVEK